MAIYKIGKSLGSSRTKGFYYDPHFSKWGDDINQNPNLSKRRRELVWLDNPRIVVPADFYRERCKVTGCNHTPNRWPLCAYHYAIWTHFGAPDDWTTVIPPTHCKIPMCNGLVDSQLLCKNHHIAWMRHGHPPIWEFDYIRNIRCIVPNCTATSHYKRGLCYRHHGLMRQGLLHLALRESKKCYHHGCDDRAYRDDRCVSHYIDHTQSRLRQGLLKIVA